MLFHCKTFLFCLRLRSGAFVLALIGLMLGGAGGVGSWAEVAKIQDHPIDLLDEIALFAQAIVFSLLGVFSFIGLLGSILNNRSMVQIYSKLVAIQFVLTVASFGFTLFYTFRPVTPGVVFDCTGGNRDDIIVQFCEKGWNLVKAIPIFVYAASLLVLAYTHIIAVNFLEEMELDEASWSGSYKPSADYFQAKRLNMV
ncbi:hypothetical protein C8J56DRAFT_956094 [Mycena floridula]|nr:hypothetical protein C8J56DRAFT_956094 [Mycena floridula]